MEQLEQAGQRQVRLVDLEQVPVVEPGSLADEHGPGAGGACRFAVLGIGQEAELVGLGAVQRGDAAISAIRITPHLAIDPLRASSSSR